jgi:hypothetical protein
MKTLVMLLACILLSNQDKIITLYDSSTGNTLSDWIIVDDGVMGGLSQGNLKVSENNHLVFSGNISLDNNGGFSSMRCRLSTTEVSDFNVCKIRVKGDGKQYQFRLKENRNDWYSYIYTFQTSGEWETIEIPLSDMYPSFRGRKLDIDNYTSSIIEEIAFLIGNKKEEGFELELDWISLYE